MIFIITFIILFFITRNYQKKLIGSLNKGEHPLCLFYSLVAFLRQVILKKQENLSLNARLLLYKKDAAAILCLLSFSLLVFVNELHSLSIPAEIVANTIQRPNLGEGEKTISAIYKSELESKEIEIHVSEKILKGEQREALLNRVEARLDSVILGENSSAGEIRTNLYFPKTVKGTNVKISYKIHNQDLIQRDGSINFKNISKEGNFAVVTACLSYEETKREKRYEFQIYPQSTTLNPVLSDQIYNELVFEEKASREENTLKLPSKVGDIELSWKDKNKERNNSFILFIIGVIVTLLMPFILDRKQKEKEEKRINQMNKDYPEIISKFQLLLTAGMTTKGAWNRIVMDYLQYKKAREKEENQLHFLIKRKKKKEYIRHAYEEMVITRREQELGVTEEVTYERFGKRCHSISYIRFATILSQNLRMGSRGIAQLLEQEAREAFGERKEQAKQLGEKASTKLLGPTMGMLLIVLVIILVPAFMNFS